MSSVQAKSLLMIVKAKPRSQSHVSPSTSEDHHDIQEEGIYIAEQILRKRSRKEGDEYLVKWLGYENVDNSWHFAKDLVRIFKRFVFYPRFRIAKL